MATVSCSYTTGTLHAQTASHPGGSAHWAQSEKQKGQIAMLRWQLDRQKMRKNGSLADRTSNTARQTLARLPHKGRLALCKKIPVYIAASRFLFRPRSNCWTSNTNSLIQAQPKAPTNDMKNAVAIRGVSNCLGVSSLTLCMSICRPCVISLAI